MHPMMNNTVILFKDKEGKVCNQETDRATSVLISISLERTKRDFYLEKANLSHQQFSEKLDDLLGMLAATFELGKIEKEKDLRKALGIK